MAMAKRVRTVQCYHCRRRLEVSSSTKSTSCPGCHKAVLVEDVVVRQLRAVTKIETAGRLIIRKGGRVNANRYVIATGGIDVEGHLNAARVYCGGVVTLNPRSTWKGDLEAPGLVVKKGARIEGGYFNVPADPLGAADLQASSSSRSRGAR